MRNHPGYNKPPALIQPMGQPVQLQNMKTRVAEDDFPATSDRRVPLKYHFNIPAQLNIQTPSFLKILKQKNTILTKINPCKNKNRKNKILHLFARDEGLLRVSTLIGSNRTPSPTPSIDPQSHHSVSNPITWVISSRPTGFGVRPRSSRVHFNANLTRTTCSR